VQCDAQPRQGQREGMRRGASRPQCPLVTRCQPSHSPSPLAVREDSVQTLRGRLSDPRSVIHRPTESCM
jgi:hypothetical protein